MIVTEELLQKLKEFGLNSYEIKLWVALLSRGVSTAGELSDIAQVPRSRTYDVLESLEKKGFIMMKIGKPIKYLAIDPERVVDVIKKNIQTEATTRSQMMEKIKKSEVLKELQLLHTQGIEHVDSTDLSGSIRGRQNLYSHLEGTISQAQKSVSILTTTKGFKSKVKSLLPIMQTLHERGVSIRMAAPLDDECKKLAQDIKEFVEVKDSKYVGRFIIVDGEEVMFMVMDDSDVHPTYDVAIWVNTPFFSQALENLFELAWNEMKVVVKQ